MGRSCAFFAVIALCALAFLPAVARAQDTCRARLLPPVEPELLRRIEGQLRDVACELELDGPSEPALATLSIEAQVDGSYAVRVQPLDGRPGHTRQVRPTPDAAASTGDELARSALFEAVALVVRGELLELAALLAARRATSAGDGDAQAPDTKLARSPTKSPSTSSTDASITPAASEPEPVASAENLQPTNVRLALGPELALAESSTPAWGLSARGLLEVQAWLLGAGGDFGLPYSVHDERTELTLRRHTLRGYFGRSLTGADRGAIALHVLASVHARFQSRETALRAASLQATADTTSTSAGLGLELGLGAWPWRAIGVSLVLGAEATLIGAPRFVYESADGERTEHTQSAALQPRAALLLELRP